MPSIYLSRRRRVRHGFRPVLQPSCPQGIHHGLMRASRIGMCERWRGQLKAGWPLGLVCAAFLLVQTNGAHAGAADARQSLALPESTIAPHSHAVLSLRDAERLALHNDQGLASAQMAAAAEVSAAKAADQLPDPDVYVGLSSLPLDTFSFTQTPMTTTEIRISQSLPPGDTLAQRALAADAKVAAATANEVLQRQILRREIGRFWLTVYRDQRTVALLQQEKQLYRRLLRSAQTAYSAGRARATDLVRLQVRLAELDDRIDRQKGSMAAMQARLARWIGSPAKRAWPAHLPDALSKLPQGSIETQPQIRLLQAKLAEARAETGEARAAFKPKFGVSLGYGIKAGNQPDTVSVGVTMSLPIFTGARQVPLLIAARKREQARQLALDNQAADFQAKAQALKAEVLSLNTRIERYDQHILPKLHQVALLAQNQFGAGGGDFTAIIDAEQAEITGRQQRLDLTIDRASRLIDLRYLLENPS